MKSKAKKIEKKKENVKSRTTLKSNYGPGPENQPPVQLDRRFENRRRKRWRIGFWWSLVIVRCDGFQLYAHPFNSLGPAR
jgi:hypothetical protein